jgi:hypothetical protein
MTDKITMTDKTSKTTIPKNWWVPLWTGLVIDQEAKHLKKMRMAIWLLLYCLLTADRKTGCLRRKIKTISHDLGVPARTIKRWLERLRRNGYLTTRSTGHALMIQVMQWKHLQTGQHLTLQKASVWHPTRVTPDTSAQGLNSQNPLYLHHKSAMTADANDNSTKEILTNERIGSKVKTFKNEGLRPSTREELLAWDLAEALHDTQGFPFYLACAKRYPEDLLRRIAGEIKLLPSHKITKSRGALFNHLIHKYANDTTHHHRD